MTIGIVATAAEVRARAMLTTKNDNTTATALGGARLAMRLPTAASTMKL